MPSKQVKAFIDYTADFQRFWKAYPKRWNRDKGIWVKRKKFPAFESWQKLPDHIKAKCLRIAKTIRASEGVPRDCVTWLNQRGWDDIEEDEGPVEHLPASMTDRLRSVPSLKPRDPNLVRTEFHRARN